MALTNILTTKELSQAYQPLLLADITWSDGTVLRASTHDIRTSTAGVQYNSHDYLPLIVNQDIAAKQALSDQGIDGVPNVTLTLADADRTLWTNYELTKGFKGAEMKLTFVFMDLATNTFSSDSLVAFVGLCDPPSMDEATMQLRAVSKLNMTRVNLPTVKIQRRHPFPFPSTSEERIAALNDPDSPFWPTGYSPDVSGGFGNMNGSVPYTADDFDGTYESYLKVLGNPTTSDLLHDTSGRYTGTFGGIRWVPPTQWAGHGYIDDKHVEGTNATNQSLYGDYIPMIYGTAMVQPPVVSVLGDANSTRGEVILCVGKIQAVVGGTISVNDVDITASNDIDGHSYNVPDVLTRFDIITNGDRHGKVNNDAIFNGKGDCYGNYAVIEYVVPKAIASSSGVPNIRAVVQGASVRKFIGITSLTASGGSGTATLAQTNTDLASNDTAYTIVISGNSNSALNGGYTGLTNWTSTSITFNAPGVTGSGSGGYIGYNGYTNNPVWVILDILIRGGWTYDDIDISSFANAAAVCSRQISYTQTDGTTGSHGLFETSLVIRQRKSVAEYLRGVRTSCRATLVPNSDADGKLQIQIDQTLADQQPTSIAGSNYNTAVTSMDHTGATNSGYVAYFFSDTNGTIVRNSKKSTLTISQNATTQSPNQVSFTFQDAENRYQQDSIATVDSEDANRASQIVSTSLNVEGISTFDHAQRIAAWWLAKTNRGNPRGDTGGTLNFQWTSSFKALHLKVGQIVMLTSAHDNLDSVLVRITKVTPAPNFETVKLEGSWHEDEWYLDEFGQSGFVSLSNPARRHLNRPPFPWLPNEITGTATDPFYSTSDFTFNVEQQYDDDAGGSTIANLLVKGKLPINQFSNIAQPPMIRPSFSTASTGGNLPGNNIYSLTVCAKDSDGAFSSPSQVVNVPIAAGTNTNTITLNDITWADGTASYTLFAGNDPNAMCYQQDGSGTPGTITLSDFQERTWGVPDIEFDRIRAKVKKVIHGGVIGTAITDLSTNSLTVLNSGWTTDEWAGRVVSVIGDKDDYNTLPVWNFTITGNTDDTLTVDGNPIAANIGAEDVLLIRTQPDSFSATTIGDSKFVNELYSTGMDIDAEIGRTVRIIDGKGAGQTATIASNTHTVLTINGNFDPVPDSTSIFIVEDSTWIEEYTSDSLANGSIDSEFTLALRIDNFLDTVLLVQLFTVDGSGMESFASKSVWREVYVFGTLNPTVTTTPIVDLQTAINTLPQATY